MEATFKLDHTRRMLTVGETILATDGCHCDNNPSPHPISPLMVGEEATEGDTMWLSRLRMEQGDEAWDTYTEEVES